MEFITLDEASKQLGISKRLLMKWHGNGMKCVRQTYLMTTIEWVNEYRLELAEQPKKQRAQNNIIKYKPLARLSECKVH